MTCDLPRPDPLKGVVMDTDRTTVRYDGEDHMRFWNEEWMGLNKRIHSRLRTASPTLPNYELDRILDVVVDALRKLLDKHPDRTTVQLMAYAWRTAWNQRNESYRRMKLPKHRPMAVYEDGQTHDALNGLTPDTAGGDLSLVRWERVLLMAAAMQYVLARAKGFDPKSMTIYTGSPSDISPMTLSCIAKMAEYSEKAIRAAPPKEHVWRAALRQFQNLLKEGMNRARVSNEAVPQEDLNHEDPAEMRIMVAEQGTNELKMQELTGVARDCVTLLRYLMPKLALAQAMECAVETEKDVYDGPYQGTSTFTYGIEFWNQPIDEDEQSCFINRALEELYLAGEATLYLLPGKDDLPLLYLSMDVDVVTLGLPCGDMLPDSLIANPDSLLFLEKAGLAPPDVDSDSYTLVGEVDNLDDLKDLFARGRELALQAYGYDPLACELVELVMEREPDQTLRMAG